MLFWMKMLIVMFKMIIVMRRSRGDSRSLATLRLEGALSWRITFTLKGEREKSATSAQAKKARVNKKRMRRKTRKMELTYEPIRKVEAALKIGKKAAKSSVLDFADRFILQNRP